MSVSFMRSIWKYWWSFESCNLCFLTKHKNNYGHAQEMNRVYFVNVLHPDQSCPKAEKQTPKRFSSADVN